MRILPLIENNYKIKFRQLQHAWQISTVVVYRLHNTNTMGLIFSSGVNFIQVKFYSGL